MNDLLTPEQIQFLRLCPYGDAIIFALLNLLKHDRYLLEANANERSITFRFAMYLQSQIPEWTVDCEYNRDGIDPKRLGHLDIFPDSDDEEARTVFPDVIVHHRGTNENQLVVEFKKSTSHVDRNIDLKKLRGYKQQLEYRHALFVEVSAGGRAGISRLEWI